MEQTINDSESRYPRLDPSSPPAHIAPALPSPPASPEAAAPPPVTRPWRKWGWCKFFLCGFAALVVLWALGAYVLVPAAWRRYILSHPGLAGDIPRTTTDGDGRPGDPLNCALIGT